MEWRPVVGWEGRYEVSAAGYVRSLRAPIKGGTVERKVPHVMDPKPSRQGYMRIRLRAGERNVREFVHRLVLEAFAGPAKGRIARHLDGDPSNNRLENLAWGTYLDNERDKRRHGRNMQGERHHQCRLTETQVIAIREAYATGETVNVLAERYRMSVCTIYNIATGYTWKHVGGPLTRKQFHRRRAVGSA